MFLKIKTKEGAFTLIELLIVIALIGLLASAVSVAVNPGKRIALANDAVRKQNFGGLTNTLLVYYVEKGSYPYVGDDLMADSTEGDNWISGLRPDYLKTIPKDPKQASLMNFLVSATALLARFPLVLTIQAAGTTYYVDCSAGSDSNNGTSQASAWKTL